MTAKMDQLTHMMGVSPFKNNSQKMDVLLSA
jgi:hypothetical protein